MLLWVCRLKKRGSSGGSVICFYVYKEGRSLIEPISVSICLFILASWPRNRKGLIPSLTRTSWTSR